MKKTFIVISCSILVFFSCGNAETSQAKLIFSETFNQSSSLFLYKNFMTVVDTSINREGDIDTIARYHYQFNKNELVKLDENANTTVINNRPPVPTIQHTAAYHCQSDSIPGFLRKKHPGKYMYELKDTEQYAMYVLADSTGLPFLGIYNKKTNGTSEVKINEYENSSPEMFLYDFDHDNIPEILIFTRYYLQNHYLLDINVYKI
jgi:hypothetical protein